MGLDSVELVLEVQDRFGVRLSDEECERARTVGQLAGLVAAKLPRTAVTCPTARAFFEFRRLLVAHAGAARRSVRPRTRLEDLLPSRRWLTWKRLRRHDRRLPRLVASPRVDRLLSWGVAGWLLALVPGLVMLCASQGILIGGGIWLGAVLGAACLFLVVRDLWAWRFPRNVETVGDMVRMMAPMELPQQSPAGRLIVEQNVLEEVRRITAEQLGLPLEQVRAESDFAKDLGAD